MDRIRKIALVEPGAPGYHVYSRISLPRLGLPLLAAILKREGREARVFCQDIRGIDYDELFSADLVGISTITPTAPEAYRIAARLRRRGIPTVIGGSHVSFVPEEALQHADYCIRGEGEQSLPMLLHALESGGNLSAVPGLSYKVGDEFRHNPLAPLICDLDSLPFPDLDAIAGREKVRIYPLLGSRGCPFNCNFCCVTRMFGRQYRFRSVESIVDELRHVRPQQVFFYDDNFVARPSHTKELLARMLSEGITPPWSAQARVDVARDRELLRMMKASNCFMLYMGLESVNPETLKEYDKRQSVEEITEAVRLLHEHGIMVHGMFVFGSDQDDAKTLQDTVRFALKHDVDTVQFMMLTPLPGTPVHEKLKVENRLLTADWALYDGQHVVFDPNKMSAYELQKETFRAMQRFYRLTECVKMLVSVDFAAFLAKFGANLMIGRWRSARRHFSSRLKRWFYRAYGHFLIRKWLAANKEFIANVKALAARARGAAGGGA